LNYLLGVRLRAKAMGTLALIDILAGHGSTLRELSVRIPVYQETWNLLLDGSLESQVESIKKTSSLPTGLSEILKVVSALFPIRVQVMSEAFTSADAYAEEYGGYWSKQEQLAIAWEMVFGLATKFYDIVFVEDSTRLEEAFGEAFSSFELAMSEGKQTKKDSRLMALRQRVHKGREIAISPHIKYGMSKPKILRL